MCSSLQLRDSCTPVPRSSELVSIIALSHHTAVPVRSILTLRLYCAALVTISHRPSLFKYHEVLLRLTGENGTWETDFIGTETEQLSLEHEIADLEVSLTALGDEPWYGACIL